jgi:hypothetical protein
MFSPIRFAGVEVESCHAHLIPDALDVSNATIPSEKEFDNTFGTMNDSRLTKYVKNCVGEEKDVSVEFYDESSMKMLHQSSFRTKSTINVGDGGARKGDIQFDFLPDELKSRIGLGIGSLCKISPYTPTQEDRCRIGLSMLHSAYLTMCYHFGIDYMENENAKPVRQTLQASVGDTLPVEVAHAGLLQFLVTPRFVQTFKEENIARLFMQLLAQNRHPVTIWSWKTFSCFGVVLPYHAKYTAICLVPGFGEVGARGFQTIMELIGNCSPIPISGTRVVGLQLSSGKSSSEFWRETVEERQAGH